MGKCCADRVESARVRDDFDSGLTCAGTQRQTKSLTSLSTPHAVGNLCTKAAAAWGPRLRDWSSGFLRVGVLKQ